MIFRVRQSTYGISKPMYLCGIYFKKKSVRHMGLIETKRFKKLNVLKNTIRKQ